ncbi:fec operon regulator FecR [Gimesia panareensis]|uniref:Fec operon regulator FecR n=1 Tax=Gimesia panareensis TaxID=2527978 RepID=A0A517Q495_9PLAN|nr:FecR domain-containing protein [Gimesia panareensis]QDT26437.1 fec operon regulator FecR [Gimesia panareensis]
MKAFTQPEEWSILLNAMAEDALSGEQELRLMELLKADAEFRTEYVRFCQLLTQLHWQSDVESEDFSSAEREVSLVQEVRPLRRWWTVSLALVLLLAVSIGWFTWKGPVEEAPGKLVRVSGRVEILRNKQAPLWISPDELIRQPQPLQPGDRLQTGRGGAATVQLLDQTRIQIRQESEVIVHPPSTGGILVTSGSISAKVAPQSPRNPLTFFLPHAEVQVLGTEFELLSLPEQSAVAVLEGKVQVTRNTDGSKKLVSTGQFLPVTESEPLSVVDWPRPADEWSVDFERGVPVGWQGRQLDHSLPNDSRGGIKSVSVHENLQVIQKIQSPLDPSGLFFWHEDSLLHLRFKVQPPGWFHIYLRARTYEDPRPALTYCYVDLNLWQTQPGEWRTVSIPLSEFRAQTNRQNKPTLGRIPLQIFFRGESENNDNGFMIDRIWVTRGDSPSPVPSQ